MKISGAIMTKVVVKHEKVIRDIYNEIEFVSNNVDLNYLLNVQVKNEQPTLDITYGACGH